MLINILSLIVDTIAGILGGVLLLRFWMQAIRVRPPAPVAQFTYQLSDWLVLPLRRLLPGVGGYDWASLLGAFLIVLAASCLYLLRGAGIEAIMLIAIQRLLGWMLWGWMVLLIIEVIFSWINPHAPMAPFVRALNDPLLRPLRRIVPPLGGLDLSVLVAFILLQIAQMVLSMLFGGLPGMMW